MIKFDGLDSTFDTLQEIAFEKTFYGEDGSSTPLDEDDIHNISLSALIDDNAINNEYFNHEYLFNANNGDFPATSALISLFGKPLHRHTSKDYEELGRIVFAIVQENMIEFSKALYEDYLPFSRVGDIEG